MLTPQSDATPDVLSEAQRAFLKAVVTGGNLGLADRAADKVRQSMRRRGFVRVLKNPRRWSITPLGLAALSTPTVAQSRDEGE